MMNVIIIVFMMTDDSIVVQIIVGWVVVGSLGSQGCWGGRKTYFQGILITTTYSCAMSINCSLILK